MSKISSMDDTFMGLMYINESLSPNDMSSIKNLDASNKMNLFIVTFDANLQDFDVMNRNRRYYDGKNIWDCIMSEKIQSLLRTGGWFGEWEHPSPERENEKLSSERIQKVPPEKRAFKIMNPRLNGNVLQAKIQSAQGEIGEGFGKEVLAGWVPQFSLRAIAHMVNRQGKPYVMVNRVITYDAPWYPSHSIAHATSEPKLTIKTVTTESMTDTSISNNVAIPLKEILEDVGRKDVNVNMIMEEFDLGMDSLIGFDSGRNHVIIRGDDNMIYANINPDTVKRVKDFYNSFN